ncbi:MAG TPA: hypothetical protein VFT46_01655 [Holophagaceae bacterium]|nr:hypothetical protein [Holophagaceae bacterium]
MRRLLPALAAVCALLALTACHSRLIQRTAVAADMQSAERAFLSGQPLPPLSSDPEKYGIYRPVMEHFYSHVSALKALEGRIAALSPAVEGALGVDAIALPSTRALSHRNLGELAQVLGDFAQKEDELAGPASDGILRRLVPEDPAFAEGMIKGMQAGREKVQFVIDTTRLKQDYYRRIDALVTMADQGVRGMSPDRKLLFSSPEALAAYNAKLQELVAFEADMNVKIKQLQAMGRAEQAQGAN